MSSDVCQVVTLKEKVQVQVHNICTLCNCVTLNCLQMLVQVPKIQIQIQVLKVQVQNKYVQKK